MDGTIESRASGTRSLRAVERMCAVADEAATLNFATSALVEGELPTDAIRVALDALRARHPLLSASFDGSRFVAGAAAPIELVESSGSVDDVDPILEEELRHRRWEPSGPRARCHLLRHGPGLATIVLSFHHVVSDGSSGVIAMRDLLHALATPGTFEGPIASPGQDTYFPEGRGGARDMVRALAYQSAIGRRPKPFRVRNGPSVSPEARVLRLDPIRFSRDESLAIHRAAKANGSTIHGVLVAAIAIAVAAESPVDGAVPIRVMHPVDMRRYLATHPGTRPIGDAIGYYVSSVETDHRVDRAPDLGVLAEEVTRGVRDAKDRGEPFLTAPAGGRLLVLARALLGDTRFRILAEKALVASTFSITNLGALESLGMKRTFGPLRIRRFGFVAAPSIFGAFCASASSFDGELELVLHHVEPRVDAVLANRIRDRVRANLGSFVA